MAWWPGGGLEVGLCRKLVRTQKVTLGTGMCPNVLMLLSQGFKCPGRLVIHSAHQRDSNHKGQEMEVFHQQDHFGENREMGPVTLKSVSKTNRNRDLAHL